MQPYQFVVTNSWDHSNGHYTCGSSDQPQIAVDIGKKNGNEGSAEGQTQTDEDVIPIGFLYSEGFEHDLPGGEKIEGKCKEDSQR